MRHSHRLSPRGGSLALVSTLHGESAMNAVFRMAAAFAAGALVMYCLDPVTGRRRRAALRDRRVAAAHELGAFARTTSKHAADQVRGVAARTRAQLAGAPVDDDRLQARIRARLGHVVAHPGRVEVGVHDGNVVLKGNAAGEEIAALVAAVSAMPGVAAVDNRLVVVADASRH